MESIEKTGETVEDAIAEGLAELGVAPHEVMVEVLEEPSRGLLGIGAKPARVRLVLMGGRRPVTPPEPQPVPAPTSAPVTPIRPASSYEGDDSLYDEDNMLDTAYEPIDETEADEAVLQGRNILVELLARMQMGDIQVTIHRARATNQREEDHWVLNISGPEISRLIGRRGATLSALQYIVRLIISRKLQQRANLIIDAGEYKAKRSERLRQLANRMADKAVSQDRVVTLEPMPPHERRIIHLTLRERQDVETYSVGEGNARKVTIAPLH